VPSDCQCSSACHTEVRTEVKVLNNKQATTRIQRLEREVEKLVSENSHLKRRLRKAKISKKGIIEDLKAQLDSA